MCSRLGPSHTKVLNLLNTPTPSRCPPYAHWAAAAGRLPQGDRAALYFDPGASACVAVVPWQWLRTRASSMVSRMRRHAVLKTPPALHTWIKCTQLCTPIPACASRRSSTWGPQKQSEQPRRLTAPPCPRLGALRRRCLRGWQSVDLTGFEQFRSRP